MRQAGKIATEVEAKRFVDYLLTIGVEAQAELAAGGDWSIWIVEETDIERGKEELAQFLAQPAEAKYLNAATAAGELRRQEANRRRQAARNVIDVSRRWQAPPLRSAPVTMALIAACVIVSLLTQAGRKHEPVQANLMIKDVRIVGDSYRWFGPQLDEVAAGQVWRLFTPMFLHFGWLHLLGNMSVAYTLGPLVELRKGSWFMLALVLVVSGVSNFAQFEGHGPIFGGFSGVGMGLFGYAWMKSRYDPSAGIWIPPNLVAWMLFWFVLCFTGLAGPVANWAHSAGLATGAAAAFLPRLRRR